MFDTCALMQGQLGMLSGGLPLASLGSFGKLSGLPSLGTLGSLGRSSGTEAPRFGAPRMPEGVPSYSFSYTTSPAHLLILRCDSTCISPRNNFQANTLVFGQTRGICRV